MADELSTTEMAQTIADKLNDYQGSDVEHLFDDTFNGDPFIIGTAKAAKALSNFHAGDDDDFGDHLSLNGAFGAIGLVQQYEQDEFGEINTDLSSPEAVASMVAYIRGERVLSELASVPDGTADEHELTPSRIVRIKEELADKYNAEI